MSAGCKYFFIRSTAPQNYYQKFTPQRHKIKYKIFGLLLFKKMFDREILTMVVIKVSSSYFRFSNSKSTCIILLYCKKTFWALYSAWRPNLFFRPFPSIRGNHSVSSFSKPSCSFAPTSPISSFTTSKNLLFGLPLFFIFLIFFPTYCWSLLIWHLHTTSACPPSSSFLTVLP